MIGLYWNCYNGNGEWFIKEDNNIFLGIKESREREREREKLENGKMQ